MRNAHRGLGFIALVAGAIALWMQASGQGAPPGERTAFAYFFAVVLVLCGFVLVRGAPEPAEARGDPPPARGPVFGEPDQEVEALVRSDAIIPAIKRYRELHGVGLKDAKDAVDAIRERLRNA